MHGAAFRREKHQSAAARGRFGNSHGDILHSARLYCTKTCIIYPRAGSVATSGARIPASKVCAFRSPLHSVAAPRLLATLAVCTSTPFATHHEMCAHSRAKPKPPYGQTRCCSVTVLQSSNLALLKVHRPQCNSARLHLRDLHRFHNTKVGPNLLDHAEQSESSGGHRWDSTGRHTSFCTKHGIGDLSDQSCTASTGTRPRKSDGRKKTKPDNSRGSLVLLRLPP